MKDSFLPLLHTRHSTQFLRQSGFRQTPAGADRYRNNPDTSRVWSCRKTCADRVPENWCHNRGRHVSPRSVEDGHGQVSRAYVGLRSAPMPGLKGQELSGCRVRVPAPVELPGAAPALRWGRRSGRLPVVQSYALCSGPGAARAIPG